MLHRQWWHSFICCKITVVMVSAGTVSTWGFLSHFPWTSVQFRLQSRWLTYLYFCQALILNGIKSFPFPEKQQHDRKELSLWGYWTKFKHKFHMIVLRDSTFEWFVCLRAVKGHITHTQIYMGKSGCSAVLSFLNP